MRIKPDAADLDEAAVALAHMSHAALIDSAKAGAAGKTEASRVLHNVGCSLARVAYFLAKSAVETKGDESARDVH